MDSPLVFITGSTGFIGSHVVGTTLRAGYRVRLSIRHPEQAQEARQLYPEYASNIEVVVIPDITKSESFKNALDNVDFIFHLASPMPGKGSDLKSGYVKPAVQGTESILYAAMDFPQIKKVILASSVLALLPLNSISKDISIKDNTGEVIPVNLEMQFPEGSADHGMKYSVSKILAHQATRDFLKNKNPHYTLISFHPTFVLGDSLIQKSARDISGMNAAFWSSLNSEKPRIPAAWVHVRDVAEAHVKALEASPPIESGKEFLLSGPTFSWVRAADFVKAHYPTLGCKLEPPFQGDWKVDTTTADQLLGLKWRSNESMIQDVIRQQLAFQEKGAQI